MHTCGPLSHFQPSHCVPAGVAAARLAADAVLAVLEPKLPSGPPPPTEAPGFLPWREDVQLALVETLAELNRMFALKGILAGCTATLVLQVRDLLAPPRGSTPLEGAAHGNAANAPRARRAGVAWLRAGALMGGVPGDLSVHPGRVGCCSGRCTPITRAAAGGPAPEQMACNDRWRQARLLP